MKLQKEIDEQIKRLNEVRPKVRPYSIFGTDNLAQLDAQIKVLEEDMDRDEIWDEWPREEEDFDTRSAAYTARDWIDYEEDDLAKDYPLQEGE